MRYSAYGNTHVGNVRDHNEDAYHVDHEGGFFVVSDGMGGRRAGEIASAITRDEVVQFFKESKGQKIDTRLREAFLTANKKVRLYAEENQEARGLGCTCVTLAFDDNDFYLAHVGDSRIYLFRKGKLKQLTRDHSYVEELFMRGLISEEEKANHPYKNSITRYIGGNDKLEVDIISGPVLNDDIFLLCSDGLSGEVEDEQIEKVLSNGEKVEEMVDSLISSALKNGGHDNVTTVLIRVEKKKTGFFKKIFGW